MCSEVSNTTSIAYAVVVVTVILQLVGIQIDGGELLIGSRVFLCVWKLAIGPVRGDLTARGWQVISYTGGGKGRRIALVESLVGHVAWVTVEQDGIHYLED